ncbi:MAG: CHAT domain-containing protein, partial [Trichodesmium sp. St18_bin3_1_1]|nr:CHAT domain-containing protein [Trichodesmium sp. St18_bin3_1_1]
EIPTESEESSSTNSAQELKTFNYLSIPELLTVKSEAIETATGVIVNYDNQIVFVGSNQVITTDLGTTIVSGFLDVSSAEKSEFANTGKINIFGEKVGLFDANLNAGGIYGSGSIQIGGDFSGVVNIPNATRTYVDEKTKIFTTSSLGEAGNVVISSAEETRFFGKIEAISDATEESIAEEKNSSKNIVEVSSQGTLIFDGTVNLGSPNTLGNLSLKSENINIVDGNIALEDNPLTGEAETESQIAKSSIETISNTNIRIEASDNITINDLSDAELNFSNVRGKISFIADSDKNNFGSFRINSENTINTQGAGISIYGKTINTDNINTKGGEISLSSSQGFVMTNNLSTSNSNTTVKTNGGDININAQGNITTGEINSSGESSGGNININSQTGSIKITRVNIDTTSSNGRGGNVRMNAATNIDIENINAEGKQSGGNIELRSEDTLNLRVISTLSDSRETGNISIIGNEINLLGGENSISSNGQLNLHSASENQNITLGGFKNTAALSLKTSDLATFANGFTSITIGKSENSGTITIYSPEKSNNNGVIFRDPVTLQGEKVTGQGKITGIDDAKITINAKGDILTGNISVPGDISLRSTQGNIKTGNMAVNISENSMGNIDIVTGGAIETGKLTTTGTTAGGNVNLQAGAHLTTGIINSSATPGNAGKIQLSAENDIEIISIQAEGGNIGGNVEISTRDSLRIAGTFLNQNQELVSISTAGELAGGNINISTGKTPFTVGDITTNGSVGAITDGNLIISPDRFLPNKFNLIDIQKRENSQLQDNNSSETQKETELQTQKSPLQPDSTADSSSNKDNQASVVTQTKSSNSKEENQTSVVTQQELVEPSDNIKIDQVEKTKSSIEENNKPSLNTNQEVQTVSQDPVSIKKNNQPSLNTNQEVQTVSQKPEASSQSLDSSEVTASVIENVDNIKLSRSLEEQTSPPPVLVVENQNTTTIELEKTDNFPPVPEFLENQEAKIIVEDIEYSETPAASNKILEDTTSSLNSAVSNQTVAIENPAQGNFSQKPTPTIVVEENITTTASEISPKNNFHQISLTDTISQIELTRRREFTNYLGKNISKRTATATNIRNTLSSVAKIDIRPAMIYVSPQPNYLELQLFLPNGKPVVKSIKKNRDEVIEVAKKFTNQIRTPRQLDSHSYLSNAKKLYKWLIAPISQELVAYNINMIVFSMDSGLRTIPIAALHDGQQFLVEKYSLGLIPSFTLTDTRYLGLDGSQVLAMGASKFSPNTNETPLPGVLVELKAIVNNLWPGKYFLNQEFTLDNLKYERRKEKFKIIHLATHVEFHPGGADNSYIQFWDTKLPLNELRQLRLHRPQIELLVLSACTTAVGDEDVELGFAGLAVQAGVKSALASLWYVSDAGTLALMTEFYQHLSKRPIKAEALRKAQLAMLRGDLHLQDGHILRNGNQGLPLPPELAIGGRRDLSHPYYWASFTMIGSPW